MSKFKNTIAEISIKPKTKGTIVNFEFLDTSTADEILKIETSCGCTQPMKFKNRVEATYSNNSDPLPEDALSKEIDPEWLTIWYKTKDENGDWLPKHTRNAENQEVMNPALDHEHLKLEITLIN